MQLLAPIAALLAGHLITLAALALPYRACARRKQPQDTLSSEF